MAQPSQGFSVYRSLFTERWLYSYRNAWMISMLDA
jgi:hypothetical protein